MSVRQPPSFYTFVGVFTVFFNSELVKQLGGQGTMDQQMVTCHCLKILCYNVCGLKSKINESDCLYLINDDNIII